MKISSGSKAAVAFALLLACVIGCKSGKNSATTSETNESTSSSSGTTSTTKTTPPDIAGEYSVVGANPNGSAYKGELEVIKHGDVYQFRWSSGTSYDGVGVQLGDVVAVAFTTGENGKGCGVVDYTIIDDGASLDGIWGYWGTDQSGTEKAKRTIGAGLIGAYEATGTNPDGKQYKAQIAIAPAGSGYRFVWSNNTEGFGIRRGDNVAVGIGGTRCGFVSYEVKSDGTLDGVWGGYGSEKTGTEKATKQ